VSEQASRGPRRAGCALVVLAAVGLAVGAGLWLGKRDDAGKTPCQLYARAMARALDHCYSGQTREHGHHIAVCEEMIDPGEACLERIREVAALSCPDLEQWPHVASAEVCRRRPPASP
jgi:hypothetical protein